MWYHSLWYWQSGGWGLKNPSVWLLFSSILDNSRKNEGQALLWHLLGGFTIAIIMPMSQTSTYGQVRALGQAPSAPKQWKSDVHVQSKTLSAWDYHWWNPRKQNLWRVQQFKKHLCLCTDGLSATQNAKGQQRVSASTGNQTRAGQGNSTHLDHLTMGLCQSSERNGK